MIDLCTFSSLLFCGHFLNENFLSFISQVGVAGECAHLSTHVFDPCFSLHDIPHHAVQNHSYIFFKKHFSYLFYNEYVYAMIAVCICVCLRALVCLCACNHALLLTHISSLKRINGGRDFTGGLYYAVANILEPSLTMLFKNNSQTKYSVL